MIAPGFCTPRMVMHMCLGVCEQGYMGGGGYERSIHDNGDTLGFDGFLNAESDLLGETLLDLQTATEGLGDACQLAKAENEFIRDIGDGYFPNEGYEVVLAQ